MGAVELDRQGIERRDFPVVRRGYDPASVDAHLRALSAEVERLRGEAASRRGESLGATAGTQVQAILEAAQATAETIEREAAQDAQRVREAADSDARRVRDEAVAQAQGYVAAVSRVTEALLERIGSMDEETRALIESLRGGAGRLAGDLGAVEQQMGELYDAAAGRAAPAMPEHGTPVARGDATPATPAAYVEPSPEVHEGEHSPGVVLEDEQRAEEDEGGSREEGSVGAVSGDVDGARLVALNMALNGDSREDTGRYIADNFDVPDRERLLDEVYAAIEG
jgi:DivIVA domain-containing protein